MSSHAAAIRAFSEAATNPASIGHLKRAFTTDWRDPLFRLDFLEDWQRLHGFPYRRKRGV